MTQNVDIEDKSLKKTLLKVTLTNCDIEVEGDNITYQILYILARELLKLCLTKISPTSSLAHKITLFIK